MGNWSLAGILLTVAVFFVAFGFILSSINIINPYTGIETSVTDFLFNLFFGWFATV